MIGKKPILFSQIFTYFLYILDLSEKIIKPTFEQGQELLRDSI